MTIRHLPSVGAERVESGPVAFGEDWPGVFIRGSAAASYADFIDIAIGVVQNTGGSLNGTSAEALTRALTNIRDVLKSCSPKQLKHAPAQTPNPSENATSPRRQNLYPPAWEGASDVDGKSLGEMIFMAGPSGTYFAESARPLSTKDRLLSWIKDLCTNEYHVEYFTVSHLAWLIKTFEDKTGITIAKPVYERVIDDNGKRITG